MLARSLILSASIFSLVGCSSVLGLDDFTAGEVTGGGGASATSSGQGGAGGVTTSGSGANTSSSGGAGHGGGGGGGGGAPVELGCKPKGEAFEVLAPDAKIEAIIGEPMFVLRRPADPTLFIGTLVRLDSSFTLTLRILAMDGDSIGRTTDIELGSQQGFTNGQIKDGKLDVITVNRQTITRSTVDLFGGTLFGPTALIQEAALPAECVGQNQLDSFKSVFVEGRLRFGLTCIQRAATGATQGASLHYGDDTLSSQLITTVGAGALESLKIRSVAYSPTTMKYLLQTGFEDTTKGPIDMRIGATPTELAEAHPYSTTADTERDTSLLGLLPLSDGSGVLLASADANFGSANLAVRARFGFIQLDSGAPWYSSQVKELNPTVFADLSELSSAAYDSEYIYAAGAQLSLDEKKNTVTYSIFDKARNAPSLLAYPVYTIPDNLVSVQNATSLPLGTGNIFVAWQEGDNTGGVLAIRAARIICAAKDLL